MLMYMLQCHTDFFQVSRLLQWIYHKDDYFIICIDANASDDITHLDWAFKKPNIVAIPRIGITWGGPSMMVAMLSAIRKALEFKDWKYFINISGYDLPLSNRADICSLLIQYKEKDYYNFISDFGTIDFVPKIVANNFIDRKSILKAPSGATIELFGEICDLVEGAGRQHYEFKPVFSPALRPTFVVSEAFEGRLIRCRPYFPFEADFIAKLFEKTPYHFGRQWIVAGRRLCEFLVGSELAANTYNLLSRSFIPDEALFQTVASAAPAELIGRTLKNNLRYKLGGPEAVCDEHFEEITNSGAIFARKLDLNHSAKLIEWADDKYKIS